jgi:class 3 adenylate cyclase/predicted ATPase
MSAVRQWLEAIGLAQYADAFEANDIDTDLFIQIDDQVLKDIGVSSAGHRLRLRNAIAKLAPTAIAEGISEVPAALPQPEAERRQLTVMFCDLVGSTALSVRFDPEELRDELRAYQNTVSSVVARYDGFVAKFMGDGVLIYFGYPRAHEDDAERAVRAGLEIAVAVTGLKTRGTEPFAVRIGIATGLVVVGDMVGEGSAQEQAVVGETPNLAARLQALAEPGQIVLAAATRRLIGELFQLRDLGRQALKGFAEPVEAFVVEGVAAAASRFEAAHRGLADFVGRAAECALLRDRLRRSWGGEGQIVLLSGDAGIGKSRLAAWLAAEVAAEPHTRMRFQCSPYHRDSILHPFVVQLGRAAHLAAEDPPETQLDKLEAILAPARIAETAPLFAALLSIPTGDRYPPLALSPAQQRRLTLAALIDQLEALARQKPVLFLFEDVHWADATSLEVLDLTVERVRALPVLVLITFRPEYEAPWTGLSHVTSIALDRLAPAEVEDLAEHVAGRPLPSEVTAQIVTKTDGVPLFVEELTKAVLESGFLIQEPQGWRLDGPLPPFAIPATLQDSLTARLDRLAPVKEIAQIGAAIGREFSYPLLRAVAGRDEPALRAALAQLEEAELLFRTGTPPDARYTFKHALVQDTAYETLLKSRRQILHRQIADVLRGEFAPAAAAEPELVAHHLTQAGLDEPAIEWWGKAGDQALRRSAFKESAAHLGKAIELADKLAATAPSADRLRLQISLGNALTWVKGQQAPETSAAFARARELASREEDASQRFSAYWGLWVGHHTRCEPAPMREMAELCLREAAAQPDCPETLIAHRISGVTCFYFGDFAGAHEHFQKIIELYDQARHADFANRFSQHPRAHAEILDAITLWVVGRIDEALPLAGRALADAESAVHAPTMMYALAYASFLGLFRRNPEAVATNSRALEDIVSRYDLAAVAAAYAAFLQGWAKTSDGAGKSRLAEMRRGIAILREHGNAWLLPSLEAALAEAEAGAGETDAGLRRLDDALAELEATENRWYGAEMHRIRGEILLKRDPADTAAAEQSLQAAIAIAQSQKARSFELRAARSLAKLYRAANRDADAHAVLTPAVEGFPPTQQFPELTEAQALLAALSESDAVKSAAALRQRRVHLQISLGNALIWAKGYSAPETGAAFARARELATQVEDALERFSAYFGLWVGHLTRGEPEPMREMAELFLREAAARPARPGCPEALVAHRSSGHTCWYFGDFAGAHEHFQKSIELHDQARHDDFAGRFGQDPRASAEILDAHALWALGRVDDSLYLAERALTDAELVAHAPTMAYVLLYATLLGLLRYNPETVTTYSQALADIVSRYDLPAFWAGWAAFFRGWTRWLRGGGKPGLAEMRTGIGTSREQGNILLLSSFEAALAEAEASAGEIDAGLERLDDALAELERTERRWYEVEMHRIRAEILLKRDPADTAAAEQSFQTAIAIAQSQKARSFELRAALSLAKLYRAANRDADAHAVLAPAVEGFPPTQQFPELGEAQTLLAELALSDEVRNAAALHQRRLHLQTSHGQALLWAKGHQAAETSAAFARARELASRVEDAPERFSAYYGLWAVHITRGEAAPAREIAELFLRDATSRPDCPEALIAHHISGITRWYFGDFAGAHEHFEKAFALYDPARHGDFANRFGQDPRAAAQVWDALALWVLGQIGEALPLAEGSLANAESSEHAPTMASVRYYRALLGLFRRGPEAVAADGQALADIVSQYDLPAFSAGHAAFYQGWASWSRAQSEACLAEMQTGIAIQREQGVLWLLPSQEAALAEAEAAAGGIDAGLKRLEEALAAAERTGEHWYEAETHRIRAEILLKRDPLNTAAAEQALRVAIAIAQSQKARSFELRAALALAKLYRSTNRDADAHASLAPAVEGFPPTEQFPEIAEAQTLLDALAQSDAVRNAISSAGRDE